MKIKIAPSENFRTGRDIFLRCQILEYGAKN